MSLNTLNKISFIGAGNMAKAILQGLLNDGLDPRKVWITTRTEASRAQLQSQLGVRAAANNVEACQDADLIVLAVKPQMLADVCAEIQAHIPAQALLVSVAAGIRCASLEDWLGPKAIVRTMPNTPSAIGMGACGLFANAHTSPNQIALATELMSATGLVVTLEDEAQIDAVTAVSGSGPAYFFLFIEAMTEAGVSLGLSEAQASLLARHTARGAAQLALESELDVAALRQQVTSPKGTTEQAILNFENNGLRAIVREAMEACAARAAELSDELGSR